MLKRRSTFLLVLSALVAAGLACATVSGPGQVADDSESAFPTEDYIIEEAPDDGDVVEQPDDADTSDDSSDAEATEAPEDDTTGSDDFGTSFCSEGPADVPVMDVETTFTYCDSMSLSFQTGEASFEDVLKFYQDELSAAGWGEDNQYGASVITQDAAVVYYVKDGRSLVLTVSFSGDEQLTTLQVVVTE